MRLFFSFLVAATCSFFSMTAFSQNNLSDAQKSCIEKALKENGQYLFQVTENGKIQTHFLMRALESHRQCDSDSDCPGFANSCFAGRCTQPGDNCESDADCPGFANSCFAGKCTQQGALCDTDSDCPGFANSCFAGKCTNP